MPAGQQGNHAGLFAQQSGGISELDHLSPVKGTADEAQNTYGFGLREPVFDFVGEELF